MATPSTAHPEERGKVFLSYSRKDRAEAQRIADALRERHFGVFKDTDDILPTEEWKTRLEQLIAESDTIVFVLSPNSAASEVCAWEVAHAEALNKRIAPVVIDDVGAEVVPEALRRLNFIFCTAQDRFEDAADTLLSSLNTDIDWIREHTRLAALASRWDAAGRPARLCLRGRDIADAEAWRDSRPREAPALTQLQSALIAASRKSAGRRVLWGGAIAGLVAIALGGLAMTAWMQAQDISRRAALFSSDAARQTAAEGDVAGALALLLDAGEAFVSDAEPPHAFLLAADNVLQRAHSEALFPLPDDAIVVEPEAFLLHSPNEQALYAVGADGPEQVATLPPLIGFAKTETGYTAVSLSDTTYQVLQLTTAQMPWTVREVAAVSVDAIGFEAYSATIEQDGLIAFGQYSGDAVIFDPETDALTPRPYDPNDQPAEHAHLVECLSGHPNAEDLLNEMLDIIVASDFSTSTTCRRQGEGVLFTMFEAPNAGTIRHIHVSEGGGFFPRRTSTMLDFLEPDLRFRAEPGFDFGVADVAAPNEARVEIRLGMMLENEPSMVFTYPAPVIAVRFLPDGRLAVLLEPRDESDERLAILGITTEAAYRPRVPVSSGAANAFAAFFTELEEAGVTSPPDQPPPEVAYHDGYEVVEAIALDDPRMAVLKLHKGMSQVEAWMYSRETGEIWRKLARNHNRVGITPVAGGKVQATGQAGTFIFGGLHSVAEAMSALRDALPDRCAAPDMRRSPCMPVRFRN